MEYDDALGMFDNGMGDGNHYHLRTRWLPALSEEAAEILIDTAGRITSPYSVLALHHFHGAATRPDRGQTAFALRDEHLLVEIIAAWTSSEADGVHREWADRASRLLAPMSLPGGYPNLLGPDDHERVRLSYGPHYDRLVRAKQHYDPDNIFASAVPTLMPAT
jgi:FAD/FMN-containing dehydrogenase